MKALLFAVLLLSAGVVKAEVDPRQPAPWTDIVYKGYYYLTSDLDFPEGVHFKSGEKFEWVGVTGGGGFVPVTVFQLRPLKCEAPNVETDIVLVNPHGGAKTQVGAQMRKDCDVVFYIENRLVGTRSMFTDSTE